MTNEQINRGIAVLRKKHKGIPNGWIINYAIEVLEAMKGLEEKHPLQKANEDKMKIQVKATGEFMNWCIDKELYKELEPKGCPLYDEDKGCMYDELDEKIEKDNKFGDCRDLEDINAEIDEVRREEKPWSPCDNCKDDAPIRAVWEKIKNSANKGKTVNAEMFFDMVNAIREYVEGGEE